MTRQRHYAHFAQTGAEKLDAFEAKWQNEAAIRKSREEEAEEAGLPWDDYTGVEEWRGNQIVWNLGGTGSYGGK